MQYTISHILHANVRFYRHLPHAFSHTQTGQIQEFSWSVNIGSIKSLLCACFSIFARVQEVAPKIQSEDDRHLFILSQSRLYRAEFEAYLRRAANEILLRQEAEAGGDIPSDTKAQLAELEMYGISIDMQLTHLQTLETAKSLWHLFEIVHIDPHISVTSQLVDWAHRSIEPPEYLRLLQSELTSEAIPLSLPEDKKLGSPIYWASVAKALLIGRLPDAIAAIVAHEDIDLIDTGLRESLIDLIESCPALKQTRTVTAEEAHDVETARAIDQEGLTKEQSAFDTLKIEFEAWQNKVREFAARPALRIHSGLQRLLRVLMGDVQAMATMSSSWIELTIAMLIYQYPFATKDDLGPLLSAAISQFEGFTQQRLDEHTALGLTVESSTASHISAFDACVRCIISQSPGVVLRYCATTLGPGLVWFSAWLADLITHATRTPIRPAEVVALEQALFHSATAKFNKAITESATVSRHTPADAAAALAADPGSAEDLREYYLARLALSFTGTELWELGANTLVYCSRLGRRHLVRVLETVPILERSPTTRGRTIVGQNAELVVSFCEKYELYDLLCKVCGTLSANEFRNDQFVTAASWLIRAIVPSLEAVRKYEALRAQTPQNTALKLAIATCSGAVAPSTSADASSVALAEVTLLETTLRGLLHRLGVICDALLTRCLALPLDSKERLLARQALSSLLEACPTSLALDKQVPSLLVARRFATFWAYRQVLDILLEKRQTASEYTVASGAGISSLFDMDASNILSSAHEHISADVVLQSTIESAILLTARQATVCLVEALPVLPTRLAKTLVGEVAAIIHETSTFRDQLPEPIVSAQHTQVLVSLFESLTMQQQIPYLAAHLPPAIAQRLQLPVPTQQPLTTGLFGLPVQTLLTQDVLRQCDPAEGESQADDKSDTPIVDQILRPSPEMRSLLDQENTRLRLTLIEHLAYSALF